MTRRDESPNDGPNGRVFYGSVTVGERGQIAIPAQARRDHGIEPGQKLIVLGNEDGLALMSIDTLLAVLGDSVGLLTQLRDAALVDPVPGPGADA